MIDNKIKSTDDAELRAAALLAMEYFRDQGHDGSGWNCRECEIHNQLFKKLDPEGYENA